MVNKAKMKRVMPKKITHKVANLAAIGKEPLVLPNNSGTEKYLADKAIAKWKLNGVNAYYNDGNVGIGTDNPDDKLHIVGNINNTLNYFDLYSDTTSYKYTIEFRKSHNDTVGTKTETNFSFNCF